MIKLSSRLGSIFDFIPNTVCLADIGCDHGYLSIAVAQAKKAEKIIAMDINKGPLESAKQNVLAEGLGDVIELRLSDGLRMLDEAEANVICICGMGGVLMKRIIDTDLVKAQNANCIIVEPQSEFMEFRRFLADNHFVIDGEALATEENKIYPIIKAHFDTNADTRLTDVQLKYGPVLLQEGPKLLHKQLAKYQKEYSEIRENLQSKITNTDKAIPIQKRIDELSYELSLIDEAYQLLGGKNHGEGDN